MILIYITCKDSEEASKISAHLLDKKLIACTNSFPIKSCYFWENEMKNSDEVVLLCKTVEKNYTNVLSEVKKIHSYQIPCIIKINVDVNKDYAEWLEEQLV